MGKILNFSRYEVNASTTQRVSTRTSCVHSTEPPREANMEDQKLVLGTLNLCACRRPVSLCPRLAAESRLLWGLFPFLPFRKWGRWDGPEENRFSVMKFDRGQNCWNGPDRSVRVSVLFFLRQISALLSIYHVCFLIWRLHSTFQVLVQCGTSNEVFGASEPNRCEYEFKFSTPAACAVPPSPPEKEPHDELWPRLSLYFISMTFWQSSFHNIGCMCETIFQWNISWQNQRIFLRNIFSSNCVSGLREVSPLYVVKLLPRRFHGTIRLYRVIHW